MSKPMTAEDVKAIRERANAASAGPWSQWVGRGWPRSWASYLSIDIDAGIAWPVAADENTTHTNGGPDEWILAAGKPEDQVFVAHARTDVPALCDEVDRLRAALRNIVEQTEQEDRGTVNYVARAALEGR